MLQSLFIYSSLFGVMMLFSLVTFQKYTHSKTLSSEGENNSFWKIYIIFPLILFAIIFGMRYDVGVDHLNYLNAYVEKVDVSKGELLFDGITHIFQRLDFHYVYYFSFLAFIQVFFFFYAFKREMYLFPFLVFFLFVNYEWMFWMNGIRQALALCIWLFAIKFIEEKRIWPYILFCLISFLFHRSAIVLIIFYPLLKNGKDYFKSIKLQFILLISVFIFQQYLMSLLEYFKGIIDFYLSILGTETYRSYGLEELKGSYIEPDGTNIVYALRIILHVIIIIYSQKLKDFYQSNKFNIIYSLFFLGLLTTYIFPNGFISLTRPFRYLYVFQTIMYAYFAYYLYKNKRPKDSIMFIGIIILFIGVYIFSQITATDNSNLLYQFYFDSN